MERRKQDTIGEIARAAVELFFRDGYDATSIEAIAAAAGCSPRTFYRYFGDKEEVMFHDMPGVIDRLGEDTARHLAAGLAPWQAVSKALDSISSGFDELGPELLPRRMQLWLTEAPLRDRYMQHVNRCERRVADVIHRHQGTTPGEDDLPELIAVAAIGAYRVVLARMPAPPGPIPSEHLRSALELAGRLDGKSREQRRSARAR